MLNFVNYPFSNLYYKCESLQLLLEGAKYMDQELKNLVSESLREPNDSYLIKDLLKNFPTTIELMNASEQQLQSVRGIGKGKARQITAMIKLAKALVYPEQCNEAIKSPKDVFNLVEPQLRFEQKEHFICLFLNTKNRLIFKETISVGSLNATIAHPREVFHAAIRRCSASLICVHNHPSGDPEPSSEDVNLTKRLVSAGEILGIEVLDHVIIGSNRFYSLKEHGHF
ncbi:DNA repair protein RadC [Paenibacillus sp. JX-17]|uniref:DNA repair protein RadC n=1 Tax=Paenibacillus lacisoli TaxID=3064525 RepID=A0ABT9C9L4_9BACL|nr:DNA repair protein RadC [Paenibacillus sp. JX-17]MDO7905349.1 DNA repair protein RadC [Paenibacillus sp. JX-17]